MKEELQSQVSMQEALQLELAELRLSLESQASVKEELAEMRLTLERERACTEAATAEASADSAKAAASALAPVEELTGTQRLLLEAQLDAAEIKASAAAAAAAAAADSAVPPAPLLPDSRLLPCSALHWLVCDRSYRRALCCGFVHLTLWRATHESRRLRHQAEEHAVAATALAEAIAAEMGKADAAMAQMFATAASSNGPSTAEIPAN
jgi:hypothetical protein